MDYTLTPHYFSRDEMIKSLSPYLEALEVALDDVASVTFYPDIVVVECYLRNEDGHHYWDDETQDAAMGEIRALVEWAR